MARVPASALLLGFAGLAPFVWGALLELALFDFNINSWFGLFGTDGMLLMTRYGTIILCFMSGVLWGFATRAEGAQATAAYVFSVLPALWIFFAPGTSAAEALINIGIGFIGVLLLDYAFWRWGLAPFWWMNLRVPLTAVVIACLAIAVYA